MFQIILWILKIIGIVLAVILGLIILLISIILFFPVCYQMDAKSEGTLKKSNIKARFSWLFHLLSGYFIYRDGKFDWQIRIGWKRLNQTKLNKQGEHETKKEGEEAKKPVQTNLTEEKQKEKAFKKEGMQPKPKVQEKESKFREKSPKKHKTSFFQKIKYTYQNMCDKIKLLLEKKENVAEFLNDTIHQAAWKRIKRELQRMLHFLCPKKLKGSICFGLEDPYNTGRVLAVLSMLYPFYGEHIEIHPDFERRILKGELSLKGRLCGIYAVIPLWNLLWDKQVRVTYQHIKTFKF